MPDASTENPEVDGDPDAETDEIVRINMRIPQEKYEWLQEHLDSFTTDTARFQHLIQFYSDHQDLPENCE